MEETQGILVEIDTDGYLDITQHHVGKDLLTMAEAQEYNHHYEALNKIRSNERDPLFWLPINAAFNLRENRMSTADDFIPKIDPEVTVEEHEADLD